MKRFYLILFIAIFSVTLSFAGIKGDINFTKTYDNTAGAVIFNHQKHTTLFIEECGFCHSALRTFGGKVEKLFGHGICKSCHSHIMAQLSVINAMTIKTM